MLVSPGNLIDNKEFGDSGQTMPVIIPTGSLTLTGLQPVVNKGNVLPVSTVQSLTTTGYAPTVANGNVTTAGTVDALTTTGYAPTVTAGGGAYTTTAIELAGSNDYFSLSTWTSAPSDSAQFIFSGWIWTDAGGTDMIMQHGVNGSTNRVYVLLTSGEALQIVTVNSSNAAVQNMLTSNSVISLNTWHHVLIAVDVSSTGGIQVYIDDVSATQTPNPNNTGTIEFSQDSVTVGATSNAVQDWNGRLADIYYAPGQHIDITVEANRRKFIDASGKPVDLGSDGSTPTGTAPHVFLKGDNTDFEDNLGSDGAFTVTGTVDNAASSPSD